MKKLYPFSLFKEETVEKEHIIKDPETGEDLKTTKKVKESIEKRFFLSKPTRQLFEDAEIFNGKKYHEAIKAGFLPLALLQKRINQDGGILSDNQQAEYDNLLKELFEKKKEIPAENVENTENLEDIKDKKENKEKLDKLKTKLREIQELQNSIYDRTAEFYARNKTAFWWALNLAYYVDKDNKEIPYFGTGNYDKKLEKYDELEENSDAFDRKVMTEFVYYTTLWFVSGANSEDDMKKVIEMAKENNSGDSLENNLKDSAETPQEKPVEVKKVEKLDEPREPTP